MKKKLFLLICTALLIQFNAQSSVLKEIKIDSIVYALDTSTKEATVNCFLTGLGKATIKRYVEYNGEVYKVFAISPYAMNTCYTLTIEEMVIEDSVNIKWPNTATGYLNWSSFSINKLSIGRGVRIRQTNGPIKTPFTGIKEIYCKDNVPIPCTIYDETNSNSGYGSSGKNYLFPFFDQELKIFVPKGAERTYMYSFGWGNVDQIIGLEELGHVNTSSLTQESLINFNQRSSIIDNNTDESLPLTLENKVDI